MKADVSSTVEPTLAPNPRTSLRLFRVGLFALIGAVAWLAHDSPSDNILLTAAGAAIMVLGAVPALNWARKGSAHFPMFEIFMLTCIPFYAVPLLAGHPDVLQFEENATWQAALAMLLFQATAIGMFQITRAKPLRIEKLTDSLLPAGAQRYANVGLLITNAYLLINGFTTIIPRELSLPIRAVCMGVGMVALFIQSQRWGARQLKPSDKVAVVLNVLVQLVLLFRELYLIQGMSSLLLALIGYVSTSRRVPIVPLLLTLPIVAVLHNGKAPMRVKYWEHHEINPLPGLAELPAFFGDWFEAGLTRRPKTEEGEDTTLAGRLMERASLFQMLCLVTERTPEPVPYLAGESYKYLPAQFVPSALWHDKPSSLQSNILLAVHYGLVSAEDPASVSIAFGMVAEAYANFGLLGCAALGALLGIGYKHLSLASRTAAQFSALGLLTILVTAWSFQLEQIFATWLVSLCQAAGAVIGVPYIIRALVKGR